jgi:hypothetical protein
MENLEKQLHDEKGRSNSLLVWLAVAFVIIWALLSAYPHLK